jgi:hypothetical protein
LTPDPGAIFGGLLQACIRDRYLPKEKTAALEGVAFLVLGVCSSFLTTYLLAAAGYLV